MINNKEEECGVADYGRRVYDILKKHFFIQMAEVSSVDEFTKAVSIQPDIILYNYHYATLPFINDSLVIGLRDSKHIAIFHEAHLNFTPDQVIDTSIRPLFEFRRAEPDKNKTPTIGSFGFGFPDKNYSRIAELVKEQFTEAKIRLNIPYAYHGDRDGVMARREAAKVRDLLQGTNIQVEITHNFLNRIDLLNFLQGNDLNLFLYSQSHGRGLASATDYALSVNRPIGVSNSEMFRHLPKELQNTDLRWLIDNGLEILKPVYEANSNEKLIEKYRLILQ